VEKGIRYKETRVKWRLWTKFVLAVNDSFSSGKWWIPTGSETKNSEIQKDPGKDLTRSKQTSLIGYLHPTDPELNNECSCIYSGHIP
jgi:hypothetical protein